MITCGCWVTHGRLPSGGVVADQFDSHGNAASFCTGVEAIVQAAPSILKSSLVSLVVRRRRYCHWRNCWGRLLWGTFMGLLLDGGGLPIWMLKSVLGDASRGTDPLGMLRATVVIGLVRGGMLHAPVLHFLFILLFCSEALIGTQVWLLGSRWSDLS